MDDDMRELKQEIRKMLRLDFVLPEDIPDKDMYMDQVTKFMEDHLKDNLRGEEDKTLTKAMINNYTKNGLLPAPDKKRYNRDHLIYLIYIYYMKNVLSISEIRKLMGLLTNDGLSGDELFEIYKKTFEMEKSQYFNIESSVVKAASITDKKIPKSEDEDLNKMLYIFLLGYDIYSKKRLIEKLIEELPEEETNDKRK